MQRIDPSGARDRLPLYGSAVSRQLEHAALQDLPPHTLMQRAADAVFRLGRALHPHARHVWIACGPGNNGGDGLLAAVAWHRLMQQTGGRVTVSWHGDEQRLPDDARHALGLARAAGLHWADAPPDDFDLAIDAILGLGARPHLPGHPTTSPLDRWIAHLQASRAPVLCVDLPSGLDPDTGQWHPDGPALPAGPRHTLALLTLKPGLFTAGGRDAAGEVWFDDLLVAPPTLPPDAWLYAPGPAATPRRQRHGVHKGSHGDLMVIGGQDMVVDGRGMTGAALLAARAGLNAGAGRVFVGLLGSAQAPALRVDPQCPELMFRDAAALVRSERCRHATTVCGCGGGEAVRAVLPELLQHSPWLVLDADALNAIAEEPAWQQALAQRAARGQISVLTPHPLEAARLLGTSTAAVQAHRLQAAQALCQRLQCTVVLKGSGSVIAAPGRVPVINPSGNALLATAGTGDVLAGLLGACLMVPSTPDNAPSTPDEGWGAAFEAACLAVYAHGRLADLWPEHETLTASGLARALRPDAISR